MPNLVSHLHTHINSCQTRASLQGDIEEFCNSVSRKLMKFHHDKWSVLYQGQKKPTNEGRLGPEQLRSVPEEKGLAMKKNAIRASSTCSKLIRPNANWAALGGVWQGRQGVRMPLHSALVWPHLD